MDIKRVAEHLAKALRKNFAIGKVSGICCDKADLDCVSEQELIDFIATQLREAE